MGNVLTSDHGIDFIRCQVLIPDGLQQLSGGHLLPIRDWHVMPADRQESLDYVSASCTFVRLSDLMSTSFQHIQRQHNSNSGSHHQTRLLQSLDQCVLTILKHTSIDVHPCSQPSVSDHFWGSNEPLGAPGCSNSPDHSTPCLSSGDARCDVNPTTPATLCCPLSHEIYKNQLKTPYGRRKIFNDDDGLR
ncbi:hypothetical protein VTG60DRAFT_6665 [Thermothelomyces hinnuleus]